MRSNLRWSRSPLLALCLASAAPLAAIGLTGCEDQLEPRAYLGPAEAPAYTAPPVYVPGTPTARPAPTDDLVELPPAAVAPCEGGSGVALAPNDTCSLGVAGSLVLVSSGSAQVLPRAASSACPDDTAATPLSFEGVGAVRAIDARGPALVAGATAISALSSAGERLVCALAGAKAVAQTPGADRGFAVTGSRDLFALEWSGGTCVVTPIGLAASVPSVLGTLALATSGTSGPWIATAERDETTGPNGPLVARARRFDASIGVFEELSPALGGQPGTVCGLDALAVSDDGERVAIIDGTCGRVVVFRASDGEIVAGVSSRAQSIAPVPGERAFLTVSSVAGKASFARIEAPLRCTHAGSRWRGDALNVWAGAFTLAASTTRQTKRAFAARRCSARGAQRSQVPRAGEHAEHRERARRAEPERARCGLDLHPQLLEQEAEHVGVFFDPLRHGLAGAVARLRLHAQQDGRLARRRLLKPRRHLARVHRIDA